jgi:pimeloyl-ACP methyl ester carboxylesterase
MFTELTLPTTFGSLRYARGPFAGPPLLFLHGVTRGWRDGLPLLPALAARWQVYAFDFRGHGASSRRTGFYRVTDYVEDAVAFVSNMCPRPPVLVGHSLGAMVALAVAADPALSVRALVLEDPPFETMGSRIGQTTLLSLFQGMRQLLGACHGVRDLARSLAQIKLVTPGQDSFAYLGQARDPTSLRFSARCLDQLDPGVLDPIIAGEWLQGYDLLGLLGRVNCPALLLQGDAPAGGMLTDRDADVIESALADCCRVKVNGAGHLIHWLQTEIMLRLMIGFLETL